MNKLINNYKTVCKVQMTNLSIPKKKIIEHNNINCTLHITVMTRKINIQFETTVLKNTNLN